MSTRCASRFPCGNNVDHGGWWCDACQEQAAAGVQSDALALVEVPNLGTTYQFGLSHHPMGMVRMRLAKRTDLTPPVLRQLLLFDSEDQVQFVAAGSRQADPKDLYRLLVDVAGRRAQTSEEQLRANGMALVLAGNPAVPARGLRALCDHPDPTVREQARTTFRSVMHLGVPAEPERTPGG